MNQIVIATGNSKAANLRHPPYRYRDLRTPAGALVGRYDPERNILEVLHRGTKHYFDLSVIQQEIVQITD